MEVAGIEAEGEGRARGGKEKTRKDKKEEKEGERKKKEKCKGFHQINQMFELSRKGHSERRSWGGKMRGGFGVVRGRVVRGGEEGLG